MDAIAVEALTRDPQYIERYQGQYQILTDLYNLLEKPENLA